MTLLLEDATSTPAAEAPRRGSSRTAATLEPDQPAAAATVTVLRGLERAIAANEPGVRHAADPGPLHDFRVAIRRTRSALGQLDRVLPERSARSFARELAWAAGATGRARDLDVLLFRLAACPAELPPSLQPGLRWIRSALESRRAVAQRRIVEVLDSVRYRRLRQEWAAFLEDGESGPDGRRPIVELATEKIARARSNAVELVDSIRTTSPDRDLHRLRIALKKLRYLLEFFRSLPPDDRFGARIKRLKTLQDELGEHNDLRVQTAILHELWLEPLVAYSDAGERAALEALEGLVGGLLRDSRERLVGGLAHDLETL